MIVVFLLKSKNFSDEQAIEAIQDAIEVKKLESKALKAIHELQNQANAVVTQAKEYKAAMTKKQVDQQNKAFESLISNIDGRQSFVEGMNLNKISKDKIKQNILNPVYKDKKTGTEYNSLMYKQTRNPVEFEMLINYYDTLGLFNLVINAGMLWIVDLILTGLEVEGFWGYVWSSLIISIISIVVSKIVFFRRKKD